MSRKKIIKYIVPIIGLCLSCSNSDNNNLGNYKSFTINIDPEVQMSGLKESDYSVDSVCSLMLPQNMKYAEFDKFVLSNNKIYLLDSYNKYTIYVFDSKGCYLQKLGERGRAITEYIGGPRDFFVSSNNDVYVYDQLGHKIMVFDEQGKVNHIIPTFRNSVHSFGVTKKGKIILCINEKTLEEKDNNPALAICNKKGKIEKELIPLEQTYTFLPRNKTFFSNGERLSHIPILSDSILVFHNDSIEKIVKLNFKCGFIMDEMPEIATDLNKFPEIKNYKGVHYVESYQETDSLILIEYIYQCKKYFWLYNKTNGKTINSNNLFDGDCFFSQYYLKGNQLIALVENEEVEIARTYYKSEVGKAYINTISPISRTILDGTISTPSIFYISLK